MASTSFEEEIYLRILTGNVVGKVLDDIGVNKLAVAVPNNKICISMGSATLASFLARSGSTGKLFVIEKPEDADKIAEYDPHVILFQFGGGTPPENLKPLFKGFINRLSEKDIDADAVIHVRTFAMGLLEETSDSPFWKDRDVLVYTADLDRGKIYLNKYENGDLTRLFEYDVSFEHADLLNRSLKKRKITFE
jgi:hypothetical protein